MPRRQPTFILILLAAAWACQRQAPADETPAAADPSASMSDAARAAATVTAMLALAERGAWDAYVDEYYGEADKLSSPDDRTALIRRFEQQWGAQVIDGLRQAASVTPVIDQQGRAVFSVDGQMVFVLYSAADGRWTFHL